MMIHCVVLTFLGQELAHAGYDIELFEKVVEAGINCHPHFCGDLSARAMLSAKSADGSNWSRRLRWAYWASPPVPLEAWTGVTFKRASIVQIKCNSEGLDGASVKSRTCRAR